MAKQKKKQHIKDNYVVYGIDSKYNGRAYKKPRRMKPRNMTEEAVSKFLEGHVQKVKKG